MNPPTLEPYLAAQPPVSDWQARVIDERRELAEKLERLHSFIDSRPPHVDGEDLKLLLEQGRAMRNYLAVLDARIARF